MFQALICPSSGVCDYVVELPHWLVSFLFCCVLKLGCGSAGVVSGLLAEAQLVYSSGIWGLGVNDRLK